MTTLALRQVPTLVFGADALGCARAYLEARGILHPMIVTSPSNRAHAARLHPAALVDDSTRSEPTVAHLLSLLAKARAFAPDAIIGLGGGSPLDCAKLVAALCHGSQSIHDIWGMGNLAARSLPLICIPTTAGTGSEVSPNAIFLDEADGAKKAVISPHLVPDAAFLDPTLTHTVPPHVTAATGLDALTHCIEAYTSLRAQPLADTWALDGTRHIAAHLATAVREPDNAEARLHVALGSLYGGLCLGPVNTAAVHALSYPLGSRHRIPHGHANAILLPHVFRFNSSASPDRHAVVALALGAPSGPTAEATAAAGCDRLCRLIAATGLEMCLSALHIAESEIPTLAAEGLAVIRLMRNNPRPMTQQDAEWIYRAAFRGLGCG